MIGQYLDGELSGESLLTFEKELQENPELAHEAMLYRAIENDRTSQSKNREEKERLASTLQGLNASYFKTAPAKTVSLKRWWYAAASVAAAVIVIFVFRPFSGESFNSDKLFAYYSKEIVSLSEGQRGVNDTLAVKAASLYNKKDYSQALPLLQKTLSAKPDDTELMLATGVCYMQTAKTDSAIKIFDKIADGSTVYKNQAIWYKALVLLKQNKLEECYTILKTIPVGVDHYKAAGELMKKIEAQRK